MKKRARPEHSTTTPQDVSLTELVALVADRAQISPAMVAEVLVAFWATSADIDTRRAAVEAVLLEGESPARIPASAVEAARRTAALKATLLEGGAWTLEDLAEARHTTYNATRQWVLRARGNRKLFSVEHNGRTLVPAVCLSDKLELRPELRDTIAVLLDAGEDGWALWAWLTSPSGWLSGQVPSDVAPSEPGRVAEAARRRATNAA